MKAPIGPSLNEQAWLIQAGNGDLDAFNYLVVKYQNLAYCQAFALLGDRNTAKDATQESFYKAFKHMGNFHGGSFQPWLLKIVMNTCYDEMRRSKRHPTLPLLPDDRDDEEIESPAWMVDPHCCAQAIVEQKDLSRSLSQMLDELSEIYRSPINLIDIQQLDYSEAANILNIPIGTVKSRLARARSQMKQKLQRTDEVPQIFSAAERIHAK